VFYAAGFEEFYDFDKDIDLLLGYTTSYRHVWNV